MLEKLKELLERKAAGTGSYPYDDFVVYDYSGSNVDDAYEMGIRHGEVDFAQELLEWMKTNG